MTHEFLNEGNPLAEDHAKHPGQLGVKITFDDGQTQMIYAPDHKALSEKVLGMYGNTRERNRQLKTEVDTLKKPTAGDPNAPPERKPSELTNDEWIEQQRQEQERKKAAKDLAAQREATVNEFLTLCPDYVATKRNGALLRDRSLRLAQGQEPTAQNYAEAYNQLRDEDLLESAAAATETKPATPPAEPSAPPPARPTGTGAPPSRMGGGRPSTPRQETYEDFANLAPSEYDRRLRNEPGFADKVNAAAAAARR